MTHTFQNNLHPTPLARSLYAHAAFQKQSLGRARRVVLIGSIMHWQHLVEDGEFPQWEELSDYLYETFMAAKSNQVRIQLTELEARHVLAQADDLQLDIKREGL